MGLEGPDQARAELLALMDDMRRALVERDGGFLRRVLRDDDTFTTPVGTVLTKTQRVSAVASGARPITGLAYEDLNVRVLGRASDVAVVTGTYVETSPTAQAGERGRLPNVFVRDPAAGGVWRLVAGQNNLSSETGGMR